MARASMANLISRVRLMIGDAAGASQVFSDDEIQNALDVHRWDISYQELQETPTIAEGGTTTYVTFYGPIGDWEEDVELVDSDFTVLSPASSDYLYGRWTFASEPTTPVMLNGRTFDLHAAAADLLESWAGKVQLDFDFSTQGQNFSRSQKVKWLTERAQYYRAKQKVKSVAQVRGDLA